MLTEGEPQEKVARLSSPTPPHQHHSNTNTPPEAGYPLHHSQQEHSHHNHNDAAHHQYHSEDPDGEPNCTTTTTSSSSVATDMPVAFPERGGGPHPMITAAAHMAALQSASANDHHLQHHSHRGGSHFDPDFGSSESPEGSNQSGNESGTGKGMGFSRKQREFIPENRKDELYWEKRRKNNEAARRSREKRRMHDMVLENRIMDLEQDNSRLRNELVCIKKRYRLPLDRPFMDNHDNSRSSPSPPPAPASLQPSKAGTNNNNSNTGSVPPPGMPVAFSEPPALLAVTSGTLPVNMQQVTMAGGVGSGVYPGSQASRMGYFMSGTGREGSGNHPQDLAMARPAASKPDSKGPPALIHASLANSPYTPEHVKREPSEDEVSGPRRAPTPSASTKQESCYGEDGGPVPPRENALRPYMPVSPPGVGHLSASATAAAAAAHYAAVAAAAGAGGGGGGAPFPPRGVSYDHQYHPAAHRAWLRASPLSSHSSDEAWDEPLQLTVHKRSSEDDSRDGGGDSGREAPGAGGIGERVGGGGGVESNGSRYSNGATSPSGQSSLPVKLRHKIPSDLSPPHHGGAAFPSAAAVTATALGLGGAGGQPYGAPFVNGLAQLSEIALAQASPLSLVKKDGLSSRVASGNKNHPIDLKHLDPKYLERRRRNNEAARKCRENRKNLTRLREAKSDYLESENNKLRVELDALQEEMKQLRELLDKKRVEQGLSAEAALQQQKFSEEQVKRLEQLEHEHRMLELEQQRLELKREKQRQDMLNNVHDDYMDDCDDSKDFD